MPVLESRDAAVYAQHRAYVLAVLARRCGWLDRDEREAVFHDAYAVMLEKERDGRLDLGAMHDQQVRAYLVQTAIHKALDEGKRAERKRSEPLGERALAEPAGGAGLDELAAASLDNARVREIVAELPERQQAVVTLRFFFDRTPDEIQRYLGISERAYRRELERALKQVAERYELVRQGRFCETRRSLILAYVGGLAGPNRAVEARNHLASCPGCARWAAELREATERVAALLPLPPVVVERGLPARVGEAAAAAREWVADLGGSAKQLALSTVTRSDPTMAGYATAARPGAVAAAVAGCLALGGGATYCVVEGIPYPLRSLATQEREGGEKRAERPKPKPRRTATPTPTPQPTVVAQPVASDAAPRRTERRPRRRTTTAAPTPTPTPPPAPVQEFGLEGSAEPVPSRAPSSGPASGGSSSPPPAPPGEFDP